MRKFRQLLILICFLLLHISGVVYAHSFFLTLILTTHILHGAFEAGVPMLFNSCLISLDTLVVLAVFFGPKIRSATMNAHPQRRTSVTLPSGLVVSGLDISSSYLRELKRSVSAPTLPKDGREDSRGDQPPLSREHSLAGNHENASSTAKPCSSGKGSYADFSKLDNSSFFGRDSRSSPGHHDVLATSMSESGEGILITPGFPTSATRRFSV